MRKADQERQKGAGKGYNEPKPQLPWAHDQTSIRDVGLLIPAGQLRKLEEACRWRDAQRGYRGHSASYDKAAYAANKLVI